MLPSRSLLLGAFFLVAADSRSTDSIEFSLDADTVVAKKFTTTLELNLDDMTMELNGESQDPSMMGMPSDFSMDTELSMEVEDTYTGMDGSRITDLSRSFDRFEASFSNSEGESDNSSFDDLVDHIVQFIWNEEEDEYERTFTDDGDVSEKANDFLEVLDIDLDLMALLPSEEVSAGDEWTVDGVDILGLLAPGIDLQRAIQIAAEEQGEDGMPEELEAELKTLMESATGKVTYVGSEEGMAELSFELELEYDTQIDPSSFDAGGAMPGNMLIELEINLGLEGTCTWNLEAGRFTACEIEGQGGLSVDMEMNMEEMGMEIAAFAELSISVNHEASAEVQ